VSGRPGRPGTARAWTSGIHSRVPEVTASRAAVRAAPYDSRRPCDMRGEGTGGLEDCRDAAPQLVMAVNSNEEQNKHVGCVFDVCVDGTRRVLAAQEAGADPGGAVLRVFEGGADPATAWWRPYARIGDRRSTCSYGPRGGDLVYDRHEVTGDAARTSRVAVRLGLQGSVVGARKRTVTWICGLPDLIRRGRPPVTFTRLRMARRPFDALEAYSRRRAAADIRAERARRWRGPLIAGLMDAARERYP